LIASARDGVLAGPCWREDITEFGVASEVLLSIIGVLDWKRD
jgi:hypothetical protein